MQKSRKIAQAFSIKRCHWADNYKTWRPCQTFRQCPSNLA